jgi:hypothetical protein
MPNRICDHVTDGCFKPTKSHSDPCPHAIQHEYDLPHCDAEKCDRFADYVDVIEEGQPIMRGKILYCKCVKCD